MAVVQCKEVKEEIARRAKTITRRLLDGAVEETRRMNDIIRRRGGLSSHTVRYDKAFVADVARMSHNNYPIKHTGLSHSLINTVTLPIYLS